MKNPISKNPLHKLMNPKSIAFVGASSNIFKMGTIQALSVLKSGFPGELSFVHPRDKIILGKKACPAISKLPSVPDLAILVVPSRLVPDMLEDFGKIGTRSAVVISAGFKETGEDGKSLEERITAIAKKYNLRFLGPNCMGIINTHLPLNTTVLPVLDPPGRLELASQSGTYVTQSLSYLHKRGICFSKAISIGNEADIDVVDALEYLGEDDPTKAIALYIEGIKRGRLFLEIARKVVRKKPVIVQYVGGTEAGARSGSSHTGALAGPDYLYEGIFKQAGIIRVHSIEELYDIGWTLSTQPPLKGKRIAILTNSGGPATAIADTCNKGGLEVPVISKALQKKIKPQIPPHASSKNPIDLTFHLDTQVLTERLPQLLFESDEIDGIISHGIMDTGLQRAMYPQFKDFVNVPLEDFLESNKANLEKIVGMPKKYGKPMVTSAFLGPEDHCVETFQKHGIPTFETPEKAANAMAKLYSYLKIKSRPPRTKNKISPRNKDAERLIMKIKKKGQRVLDEFQSKQLLSKYGLPTVREELALSLSEAKRIALKLGYPLVLKGCSDKVLHKTEKSMLYLNIKDEKELEDRFQSLRSYDERLPVLIQKMLKGEREFMAGMTRFPGFGPFILFGLGGIFTEVIKDTTFRLAPLSREEAREMLDDIKSQQLLGNYRGMKAVDKALLAEILIKLGEISLHFPEIKEMDLNPIMIVDGKPLVADALILLEYQTKV